MSMWFLNIHRHNSEQPRHEMNRQMAEGLGEWHGRGPPQSQIGVVSHENIQTASLKEPLSVLHALQSFPAIIRELAHDAEILAVWKLVYIWESYNNFSGLLQSQPFNKIQQKREVLMRCAVLHCWQAAALLSQLCLPELELCVCLGARNRARLGSSSFL